jgi:hypothetical protein
MRPDPQVAPGRAARIGAQLLRAVAHLEAHDVVHRDVKLDNVLLDGVGDELNERVVLTDFGMCFDCRRNRVEGFRVMLPYDGFQRGGAPIALAPEVSRGPWSHSDAAYDKFGLIWLQNIFFD